MVIQLVAASPPHSKGVSVTEATSAPAGGAPAVEQVIAVRYGTRNTRKSDVYLNYDLYAEPDAELAMDYYFWVLRGPAGVVLIDCGFNEASGARRGRQMLHTPVDALRSIGVAVADVSALVITHAHYDHTGNLAAFPDVPIYIAAAEFDFWTGADSRHEMFTHSAERDDVEQLREAHGRGRVKFVQGSLSLGDGIDLIEVGGHTPGQLIVTARTAAGTVVLAADAVHYYEELALRRPFRFVADLVAMYRAFDRIDELTGGDDRMLVAGHDPEVMHRYPPYSPASAGSAVRVA